MEPTTSAGLLLTMLGGDWGQLEGLSVGGGRCWAIQAEMERGAHMNRENNRTAFLVTFGVNNAMRYYA